MTAPRPFNDVCAGYYAQRLEAARAAGDHEAEQTALRLMQELADREVSKRLTRTDEADTVVRFDSDSQPGDPHMPNFAHFLALAGGDHSRASILELEHKRRQRRDASAPTVRSDAADRAQDERRIRNATAWTQPLSYSNESPKEAQHRAAVVTESIRRADAAEAERRAYRAEADRVRLDAAAATCSEHGKVMMEGNDGPTCPECAERDFKRRQRSMWKKPLQATNQRSAGTVGTHWTDDDGDAA